MGKERAKCAADGIVVSDVTFGYDSSAILSRISLEIRKGTVVALLGPNGCGKTTLLRIINGSLKSDRGAIYLDGSDLARTDVRKIARKLGQVSQSHKASFPFTVLDVVLTGRAPYIGAFSSPGQADLSLCRDIIGRLGIACLSARDYTKISGGERQLVLIARALAQEPEFLLLDEPTTFLDLKNQIHILRTVVRLAREKQITVLMTLHDPNHALMFADTIILMRRPALNGDNVVAVGPPARAITPENVLDAYGVSVDVVDHRGHKLIVPIEGTE